MLLDRCCGLFLIVICSLFTSYSTHAADLQWDSRVNPGRLDNGFKYVFYNSQNPQDPFNLRLIVNVGSVDDEHRGMAHIVEHMVFRANRAHDVDMHRLFDQIGWKTGVQINALTRPTETQYMVRTRPNDVLDVKQSVQLLSDLAFGAKMLEHEWQIERDVILEEMRGGAGTAERINNAKKKIVRNGSRYTDRPTIGIKQDIMKVKIEDIRAFYKKFYVPGNMTLVASGYFDSALLTKAIEFSFGNEKPKPVPNRDYIQLPLQDGLVIGKVQDPKGTTSAVVYGFRHKLEPAKSEAGSYQRFQNYFLRKLLKPMVRASKEEYGPEVSSVHIRFSEPTNERLVVAVAAKTKEHAAGLQVVLNEIERLKQNGIKKSDLLALKAKARATIARNRELISKRTFAKWEDKLTSAVIQETVEEDYARKSARTLKWIDELTVDSLNKRVMDLLNATDQFLFYQIPGGESRKLPSVIDVRELARLTSEEKFDALKVESGHKTTSPTVLSTQKIDLPGLNVSTPRVLSKHRHFSPKIVQWKLANGDNVVWLDRKNTDNSLYIKVLSKAGFYNQQYAPWLSQAALQIWQQSNIGSFSSQELAMWQSQQNARWSWVQNGGDLDLSAKVSIKALAPLMHVYSLMQTDWQFNQDQFDMALNALKPSVKLRKNSEIKRGQLWGAPSGLMPTQQELDGLTHGTFEQAITRLQQQPASLYIVGSLSESEIEKSVLPYLARIKRQKSLDIAQPVLPKGTHRLTQFIHDEHKSTVVIKSESDLNWSPERSFILSALNPIIQKALKNKLRHELGGVYSLKFEMALNKDNKVRMQTTFFTAPEKAEALVKAHNQVLNQMSNLLSEENYPRIQSDIEFAEKLRLADPNTWLRRLALSYQRYQGPDYLRSMLSLNGQVTRQNFEWILKQVIPASKQAIWIGMPIKSQGDHSGVEQQN